MSEQLALLPTYLTAHLQLSLFALVLGAGISAPLGVFVTRRRAFEAPLLGVAAVIQTIPSLALLAIMVPLLAAASALAARAGVTFGSIGFLPAAIALTLYSMLPILRNTVAGIASVDPALLEAARGVGMTPRQQLLRVELPLALPVIVAGVRTSAVWVVGTATLATPVGATSLGNFIFSGLQTRNDAAVALGCIAAAALALTLDQSVRALEFAIRRRKRKLAALLLAAFFALGLWLTGAAIGTARAPAKITVGAKGFTEQFILAEVLAAWVRAHSSREVKILPSLGTTVISDGLASGDIDLSVEYSGTVWADLMERGDAPATRAEILRDVSAWLRETRGVETVAVLGFENAYALAMRSEDARARGVRTLHDLARVAPSLRIGGDIDFFERAEWRALRERYGFKFRARRSMDSALMYSALEAGQVDVISAYSSDGRIARLGLRLLADELGVIPPYDAMLLASKKFAREEPALLRALAALSGRIDVARMQRMNLEVDGAGRAPAAVAQNFVRAELEARAARPVGAAGEAGETR